MTIGPTPAYAEYNTLLLKKPSKLLFKLPSVDMRPFCYGPTLISPVSFHTHPVPNESYILATQPSQQSMDIQ